MRRYATLDLFSGVGAFSYGLEQAGWFRTVAFVEVDEACRAVLRRQFPGVAIFNDVREVSSDALRAAGVVRPDAIVGGFPCQPFSVAGKRRAQADDRHLWPEFARIVRELKPRWVIGENVPGIRTSAADEVMGDLEAAGYACGAFVVGADDVGAPHRRKRVWFVAHTARNGRDEEPLNQPVEAGAARRAAVVLPRQGNDVGHADGEQQGSQPRVRGAEPGAEPRGNGGDGSGAGAVADTHDGRRASEQHAGGGAAAACGGEGDAVAHRAGHVADTADNGSSFGEGFGRHLLAQLEAAHRSGRSGIWPRGERAEPGLGGTHHGPAAGLDEVASGGEGSELRFPTPVAKDDGKDLDAHLAMKRRMGRNTVSSLAVMARSGVWPTPCGADHKGANPLDRRPVCDDDLPTRVVRPSAFPVEAWERGVPRVIPRGQPGRTTRLQQLGNSIVWLIPCAVGAAIVSYDLEQQVND